MTLADLAAETPHTPGRWHRGADAARADLRRILDATRDHDSAGVLAAWLYAAPPGALARTERAGYRAVQTAARHLTETGQR